MAARIVRPPVRIFRAQVVSAAPLSRGMIRVTLGGPGVADFRSSGVGDEYVRVFLPRPGQAEPVLPVVSGDHWAYPDDVEPAPMRTYTVRAFDPGRGHVVIDVVAHEGGVAATWARRASPGDVVGLTTPSGLHDLPAEASWQLLLADATGLPAVGRLLEQAPPRLRTRAILEVTSAADRQAIDHHDAVEITWFYGGNGRGPSRLEDILRSIELPAGPGYLWAAGETRAMRGVRRYLRHELGLEAAAYKVVGYWTDGAEDWMARYGELGEAVRAELVALWESDRDLEEIEDEYAVRLDALGL